MKDKDQVKLSANMSPSTTQLKLDQLLQQVVAQSTKDAIDAKKNKRKKPKSHQDDVMLETLRKAEDIESLHKETDNAVLANIYSPESNTKNERHSQQQKRRHDKNKNSSLEEMKQNVDIIEPAPVTEKKKKKAKKKKEIVAEVEQEVREQPAIEQSEKIPRPSPRKIKSPDLDKGKNIESTNKEDTPQATPRKKKINKLNEVKKEIQKEPTDTTIKDDSSGMKTKEKKKKKSKVPELLETDDKKTAETSQDTTLNTPVKIKTKKIPAVEEEIIPKEKAVEQSPPPKTKTKIKKLKPVDDALLKDDIEDKEDMKPLKPKPRKKKKETSKEDADEQKKDTAVVESAVTADEKIVTPTKKQKKKLKATESETVESTAVVESPQDIQDMGEVLALVIHRTDKLKNDFRILHPVVRVHVINEETGEYLLKQHQDRAVTSYFETSNKAVKSILPMMTQPFDFKERKSTIPVWEDLLVFNENFNYFIQTTPKVILLFELLDFVSMNTASNQFSTQKEEGGWHKIAWAFLKVLGKNGKVNIGSKLRLQLFLPPTKSLLPAASGQPKIYQWWKSAQRIPYPSTLYVTLKSVNCPQEVTAATRSMFATQKEVGQMSYKDLKSLNWSDGDKTQSSRARYPSTWTRIVGQLCRIPNVLTLTLKAGRKGCFMVKFSNDGRSLACACQDGTDHPVLVYEIPSGELRGQFQGHFGIVYSLSWNKSDTLLLTASSDGTARVWDIQKLEENQTRLLPHPGFVYTAEFHPRVDSIIVSGCYDEVVRVWDISMPEDHNVLQQEIEEHHGHVNSICFDTDDGQKMYSSDSVGTIIIWNCYVSDESSRKHFVRDWTKYMEIKDPDLRDVPINFIAMHPSGRRLLVHGRNNAIFMFDLRVQRVIQKYFGAENLKEKICSTITPCGSFVFSGSEDGRMYAWNTDTGDQVAVYTQLNYHMPVTDVHYHPRDHMLALCSLGDNHPVYVYKYDPLITQTDAASPRSMSPIETTDIEEMESARTSSLRDACGRKVLSKEEFETLERVRYQRVLKKLETATAQMSQLPGMVHPEALYSSGMDLSGRSSSQLSRHLDSGTHYTLSSRSSAVPPGFMSPHSLSGSGTQLAGHISTHKAYLKAGDGTWRPGFTEVGRSGARSQSPTYYGRPPHLSLSTSLGKPHFTVESPIGKSSLRKQVIANYDYKAQRSDELTLYKGDVITILFKDNESWWMGELSDGQQGFFPSNYVTEDESEHHDLYKTNKNSSSNGTVTAVRTKTGELRFLSGGEESEAETPRSRKKKQVSINLNPTQHGRADLPPTGRLKELNTSVDALLDEYESMA